MSPPPEPTVIITRPRRSRGLVIAISVLVTAGLAIGAVLLLTRSGESPERMASSAGAAAASDTETTTPAAPARAAAPAEPPPEPAEAAPADTAGSPEPPALQPPAGDREAPGQAAEDPAETDAAEKKRPPEDEPRRAAAPRRRASRAPREPAPAWLALEVQPAGAAVVVDGEEQRGRSPLRVGPLEPGKHTVQVSAPGREPAERTVRVRPGETEALRIALRRKPSEPAKVHVRSTPSGAAVVVDGKVRGTTPLRGLTLPPDRSYELTLRRAGHKPWQTEVEPVAGQVIEIAAALAPRPTAAAAREKPAPVEKQRDVRVPFRMVGEPGRGKALFGRCRSCHGSSAPELSPRRYTQRQWTRYLASRRHSRHAELRPVFSVSELADVKAYLLENAADVARGVAAGVR